MCLRISYYLYAFVSDLQVPSDGERSFTSLSPWRVPYKRQHLIANIFLSVPCMFFPFDLCPLGRGGALHFSLCIRVISPSGVIFCFSCPRGSKDGIILLQVVLFKIILLICKRFSFHLPSEGKDLTIPQVILLIYANACLAEGRIQATMQSPSSFNMQCQRSLAASQI